MYIKCLFRSLLLLSCLSLFKSETSCPRKKKECADDKAAYCHIYGTEGTGTLSEFSEYFRTCPKNENCKIPLASKVGQCLKNMFLLSENQTCSVSSECRSGVCKESKCIYVADGEICDFDSNCGRESFCENQKCVPLKKEGEDCIFDKECQVGFACGKTNGNKEKCTKMFSLEPGDQSNNELLCKDGYIHSIGNIYYCAKATLENEKCQMLQTEQCKMTINVGSKGEGLVDYGTCKCNWNGEAYCQPVSSSAVWTNFVDTYSKDISKVNNTMHYSTMREDWWGVESIIKAWVDYKEYFNLKDADSCVKEFYYRQALVNVPTEEPQPGPGPKPGPEPEPTKGGYMKMAFMSILMSFVILL